MFQYNNKIWINCETVQLGKNFRYVNVTSADFNFHLDVFSDQDKRRSMESKQSKQKWYNSMDHFSKVG